MPIKKQEFYEGAALHLLARTGQLKSLDYEPPFFLVNNQLQILLKYSTRGRSPWGFTFTTDEQQILKNNSSKLKTIIGLICGADGIAAFCYEDYISVAAPRDSAIHIACYRGHHEHYEVNGPDGTLAAKVAPSDWQGILKR